MFDLDAIDPAPRETPQPAPQKRQRKTTEQQIAAMEEKLRQLKKKAAAEQRKARNHRLITSAATIEAESGIELDEDVSRWLGRVLKSQVENHSDSEIARHVIDRDKGGE